MDSLINGEEQSLKADSGYDLKLVIERLVDIGFVSAQAVNAVIDEMLLNKNAQVTAVSNAVGKKLSPETREALLATLKKA